jgi:GDP-L-fucose synthase
MARPPLAGAQVLVTGGAGFIGTHLIGRLRRAGARVRATVHRQAPALRHPEVDYVVADLTRLEDCQRVVADAAYVFHCAANTSGAAVMVQTPLVHVTPNVVMNAQLLDAAHAAGVGRFLFISSGAAYPPTDDRPVGEAEMFAGEPYAVYHPVAWMKRYTEILCETYARRVRPAMSTVVVRPSNVYGPWDKFDFATSHVTAALLRRVVERHTPLAVWGTGADVRDLLYVDDFIEGVMRAVADPADYLAVNLAAGQGYSVREVLATLLDLDGFTDADVRFDPSRPSTIPVRLIDPTLARTRFDFQTPTALRAGLAHTLRWYRARRGTPGIGVGGVPAEDAAPTAAAV